MKNILIAYTPNFNVTSMKTTRVNVRAGIIFMSSLLFLFAGSGTAYAAPVVPAGFEVTTIASGLTAPTTFALVPDGRVFVAQKSGAIMEIKDGVLQPTPVVQLTDVNDYGDRGVEGIAVDPNFATNGYIYLSYTYENTPGQNYSGPKTARIVRLTVNGDTADLASMVVILGTVGGTAAQPSCLDYATSSDCIPSDSGSHSAGALRFGPDGKLYASLGDGAGYTTIDPEALDAQDVQSLGGKIIRINTDGTAPADNPFYDGNPSDNQSKVWALGNRNMYRFSFRQSDGKMFIGAVGWNTWESVFVGKAGANYGWPCLEGFATTTYDCTPSSTPTSPIYVYDHSAGTASVIGGAFPTAYPSDYTGNYFFGDYTLNVIKRMVLNADDSVASVSDFITNADGPVDFQVGPDGNLWYLALNTGELREVVNTATPTPPVPPTPVSGTPAPHAVSTTIAPEPVLVGQQQTVTTTVANSGDAAPFVVDVEVYDASGQRVAQQVYPNTTIPTNGTSDFTTQWTPTTAGNYTVKVGLFHNDWSGLYEWTDEALAVTVLNHASTGDPAFAQVTTTAATSTMGAPHTITTVVQNSGEETSALVDIEVYQNGNKVGQQFFDNQFFVNGQSQTYTYDYSPPTAGTYTVSVGIFKKSWSGLYEWFDQTTSFTAGDAGGSVTPPPQTPVPHTPPQNNHGNGHRSPPATLFHFGFRGS